MNQGSSEARTLLIEHNMRLVAHIIKKYAFTDKETDDLLSIGTIGLIKAVNTFDVSRGNRLSSYAAKCIDNEILMLLRAEKKSVKKGRTKFAFVRLAFSRLKSARRLEFRA